jgi:SnoaL-like polyketide cyclase
VAAHLLIREYYTCFNERRFADAADLFASDAVLERPLFGTLKNGGEGYLHIVDVWVNAFPDSKVRIEHVEQRGDTICEVDLVLTGTHLGNLNLPSHGVFAPTRQTVALAVGELLEIRARKITYSSVRFDVDDLIRQVTRQD